MTHLGRPLCVGLCLSIAGCQGPPTSPETAARYERYCAPCHDTGAAGAPRRGDEPVWRRIREQDLSALVDSVEHGTGAMPPMGRCDDCSREELQELVEFVSQ